MIFPTDKDEPQKCVRYDGTVQSVRNQDRHIIELRYRGLTFKEIAKMYDIGTNRARERYLDAKERELRRLRIVKPNEQALAFWL